MTDLNDYLHYFKTLADEHVDIKDFYIMDINEPLAALRGEMKYPVLILNALTGNFAAPNLDAVTDEIKGGFLIIGQLAKLDDFPGEMTLLQQMKQIGVDILARMLHDVWKCEPRASKAIPGFKVDSVTYQQIDQIFENCFGYLFNFTVMAPVDLQYDETKWDSEKEIENKYPY